MAKSYSIVGLPQWLSGKELPASAGDTGSIPGSRRSLEEEMATHFSILAWKNPMDRGSLVGYSPWDRRVGHNLVTAQQKRVEH